MSGRKWMLPGALALLLLALAALRSGWERGPVTVTLNGRETPVTLTEDEIVYLTVEPAAVTATGAAATIHLRGIPQIQFGDRYYIAQRDRYNSRKWTEVPWVNGDEPETWLLLITLGFDPDGVPEAERWPGEWDRESDLPPVDWGDVYGPLEPGEYLFIKEVMDPDDRASARYIGAAFTVEKE